MANEKPKEKKKLIQKLRNKYHLIILNDDTFEEKFSLKLSRLNVFLVVGTIAILLVASTIVLIAFTPLGEYISGYSDIGLRKKAFELAMTSDSLKEQMTYSQRYLLNIRSIIEGKPVINFMDSLISDSIIKAELSKEVSKRDLHLHNFVEETEDFNVVSPTEDHKNKTGSTFLFR